MNNPIEKIILIAALFFASFIATAFSFNHLHPFVGIGVAVLSFYGLFRLIKKFID